ncbi:XRN 5'-3' exonuclease amine-terminal protein [Toxoplasma gondii MAS]|uniref:XRN 5'-3' exonuclease amine-terminal protein n=1 Tax=Toxoplasma gondii MAS TaxID=943118 RepID=A0A086QEZ1_TOXGO|nr:XRN 5'-3' exonuclease amine-terminal protein [Toxoplasma gondii MAS]
MKTRKVVYVVALLRRVSTSATARPAHSSSCTLPTTRLPLRKSSFSFFFSFFSLFVCFCLGLRWSPDSVRCLCAEAGIPGLHNWLRQAFPSAVSQVNKKRDVLLADHLLFDLNQLLHQAALLPARGSSPRASLASKRTFLSPEVRGEHGASGARESGKQSQEVAFDEEADAVLRRLVSLISATLRTIHPRKSVVFALDGVPPLAKLLTTAKRRRKRDDEEEAADRPSESEEAEGEKGKQADRGRDAGVLGEGRRRGEANERRSGCDSNCSNRQGGDAKGMNDDGGREMETAGADAGGDTVRKNEHKEANTDADEGGKREGGREEEPEDEEGEEERPRSPFIVQGVGATLEGLRLPDKPKKERYRIPSFLLTPGTAFMQRVEETCRRFAWQRLASRRFRNLRFFVSGSSSFGEGELKLIDWLLAAQKGVRAPVGSPSLSSSSASPTSSPISCTSSTSSTSSSASASCRASIARCPTGAQLRLGDGGENSEEARREQEREEDESIVIVGADADLVVQALAFPGVPKLFVYNPQRRISDEKNTRTLYSLRDLLAAVDRQFPGRSHLVRNDLALLCVLNGNDYLPKAGGFAFPRFFEAYSAVRRR